MDDDLNKKRDRLRQRKGRLSRAGKFGLVFLVGAVIVAGGYALAALGKPVEPEAPWAEMESTTTEGFWLPEEGDGQTSPSTTGSAVSPSTTVVQATTSTTHPSPPGRQIGAIVYLDGKGLPEGTWEALEETHATEVYLYVAYYSDAYYAIPRNPYGLALPADTLTQAVKDLHEKGYRVIGTISTALLDWRQAPKEGLELLQQDDKPIFHPVKAGPFVEQLTRALVRYDLDGIYIGEPYWLESTSDEDKKLEWNHLYERLLAITQEAGMPFHMIMPTYNGYFTIHPTFADLPFHTIGMDAEWAWHTEEWDTNLAYYQEMIDITRSLAKGRDSLIEVNLNIGLDGVPAPPDFFDEQLRIAKEQGMKRVVLFAATFWKDLPENVKTRYSAALEEFLAP